jgi:hypothetical protein
MIGPACTYNYNWAEMSAPELPVEMQESHALAPPFSPSPLLSLPVRMRESIIWARRRSMRTEELSDEAVFKGRCCSFKIKRANLLSTLISNY